MQFLFHNDFQPPLLTKSGHRSDIHSPLHHNLDHSDNPRMHPKNTELHDSRTPLLHTLRPISCAPTLSMRRRLDPPRRRNTTDRTQAEEARRWRPSSIVRIFTISIALNSVQTANSCQQTITLESLITECITNTNNCAEEKQKLVKINPVQPKVCLHIRQNNHTVGQLKLTLKSITLRCNKETLFFTRNTATKVQHSK